MDFRKYKGFVIDLDGVVRRGSKVIPGVPQVLALLKERGAKVVYLTNNAGIHHQRQAKQLDEMGINCEPDMLISAGYATACYLMKQFGPVTIYVMGPPDLQQEMLDVGHSISAEGSTQKVDFVVVGFDRDFSYQKLDTAFQAIQKGARFVACNENPHYPGEDAIHPGVGSSVAALSCCAGRAPDIVVGKPNRPIMETAMSLLELDPSECLMVGDILEFDILAGQRSGMDTLFVLSGVGKKDDIEITRIEPTFVLDSLAQLAF